MPGTRTAPPDPAEPHRTRVRAAAAAAVACGALLVAGCGSGGGAGSGSGAAASAGARSGDAPGRGGAFAAYVQCLEQNGYTPPPRPSGAPSGMARRSGRPGGWNPSDRPSDWPSGRPSDWPSGRPSGMPRGGFGMGDTADPAFQKAAKACESKRPSFGGGRYGGNGSAAASALRAFADCMKGKGITVPAGGRNPLAGLPTSDARTAAALAVCRPLLPSAAPQPSASASPSA